MQKTKHRNLLLTPIRPSTCRTSGALSPLKYTSIKLYCFVLFYIRLVVLHDESVLCNCIGILCSASERPLEAGEGKHLKLGKFNLSLLLTAPCGGRGGVCVQKTDKVWGELCLKRSRPLLPSHPFQPALPRYLAPQNQRLQIVGNRIFVSWGRSVKDPCLGVWWGPWITVYNKDRAIPTDDDDLDVNNCMEDRCGNWPYT